MDNGKFGVIVVILAMLGTGIFGYIGDTEKVPYEYKEYNYITDVSGLVEGDDTPSYIEYNPSSNITGYTGDVVYSLNPTPNVYRIVRNSGATVSGNFTIDGNSNYATYRPNDTIYTYVNSGIPNFETKQFSGTTVDIPYQFTQSLTDMGKIGVSTLKTIFQDSVPQYTHHDNTTLDISYPTGAPIFMSNAPITPTEIWVASPPLQPIKMTFNYINDTYTNLVPTKIEYNRLTNLVSAYRGDDVLFIDTLDNIWVLWYSSGTSNGVNVNSKANISYEYAEPPIYDYINPSAGISASGTVNWDNGYELGEVTMVVGKPASGSGVSGFEFKKYSNYIAGKPHNYSGKLVYLKIDNTGLSYGDSTSQDNFLGEWDSAILHYNYVTDELTVIPSLGLTDYQTAPPILGEPVNIDYISFGAHMDGFDSTPTIEIIKKTGIDSLKFNVINTTVFLDTYGIEWKDPTLNIADYWVDLEEYRLNFYSFAVFGDEITINNVTFNVDENQKLWRYENIDDIPTKVVYGTLSNVYVSKIRDGNSYHMYLTFGDTKKEFDLGTYVTDEIDFNGLWAFSSGLYDVNTVHGTKTEVHFGEWGLNNYMEMMIIFFGFIALCFIVGKAVFKQEAEFYDYAIIFGAVIFAILIGGF